MKNRRNFIKHAGAFALGTFLLPACTMDNKNSADTSGSNSADSTSGAQLKAGAGNLGPIGLQLYSVKDVLEDDLKGTLQQLASYGYKEVESYPGKKGHYYGMQPKEFKQMLDGMGLVIVSSHFGSGKTDGKADSWHQATMLHGFEELATKAAETGQKYLTCSSLHQSLWATSEDLKRTADLFNKTGEICKKAGLTFAYHNHDFEFNKVGEVEVFDFLLKNTDPALVKYELDIYWAVKGGKDPIAYFQQYPDRFKLCHVKDMDKQDNSKNTEIGQGTIDYPQILEVAKQNGMEHYLVEQETFTGSSLESMKMNYDYLASLTV